MAEPHAPIARFVEIERTIRANIADCEALHAALCLRSVEAPGDAKARAETDAIEAELAGHRRHLERHLLARQEAERLASKEACEAELAVGREAEARLTKRRPRQQKLISAAVKHLRALSGTLAELTVENADAVADVRVIARVTGALREDALCTELARYHDAAAPFIDELRRTGIEHAPYHLHPWVSIRPAGYSTRSLAEIFERADEKLFAQLNAVLAKRAEELGLSPEPLA